MSVTANQTYAARLGWTPENFNSDTFDSALVSNIKGFQTGAGLEPDGIAGPRTYAAWIDEYLKFLVERPEFEDAGTIAVFTVKRLWLSSIVDLPPTSSPDYERCRAQIDALIRTPAGIDWSWEPPYPNQVEWCGTIAAKAWSTWLPVATRRAFFASTYRLDRWARYAKIDNNQTPNPKPAQGPYRMIIELNENSHPVEARFPDGTLPRAGDIVMVGGAKTGYGKHITVAERFDEAAGIFTTIEGNATGLLPNGSRAHGVIRATRRVGLSSSANPTTYHVRRVIRPAPHDIGIV